MPLDDGTNAEREDPQPPLGWTSAEDIKDCKVYGGALSPPCFKVLLILKHFGVPHTLVDPPTYFYGGEESKAEDRSASVHASVEEEE